VFFVLNLIKSDENCRAGEIENPETLSLWSDQGIEVRIPEGSEYNDPKPPLSNHFCGLFILHKPSKTIHVDDTLMVSKDSGFLLRFFAGFKEGSIALHRSWSGPGLVNPQRFICWMDKLIADWDFDNIASAHTGYKLGGCKDAVSKLMEEMKPKLMQLNPNNRDGNIGAWTTDAKDTCECG
jgi:hypothetical protein